MKQRAATPFEDWANGWVTEGVIITVEPNAETREDGQPSGWTVTLEDHTGCGVRNMGTEPKPGDMLTIFGQWGYPFHGQALNGKVLWYESPDEEEAVRQETNRKADEKRRADFEKNRAKLDADYNSLPETFQARIDKFRNTNPDFRWQHEAYEMSCCVDAIKIAEYCIDHGEGDTVADRVLAYQDLPSKEQKKAGIFDGHSGNSFGFACRLAYRWVTDPGTVVLEHGALAVLVGCKEYGCPHPDAPEGDE
jgi:hypothetical protein